MNSISSERPALFGPSWVEVDGPSHHGAPEEASAGREAGATLYLTGDGFKSGQEWTLASILACDLP